MENFNWIHYVASSPDLIAAGILSKESAVSHYLTYGRNEIRSSQIRPTGRNLIFQLHFGLANQLYGLLNGIFLAHYSGRQAQVRFFSPQFDKSENCPLSEIIDLPALNELLRSLNINTTVSDVRSPVKVKIIDPENYRKFEAHKSLQSFSILRDILHCSDDDVDILFPCNYPLIECYPDCSDRQRITTLLAKLKFTPIFSEIKCTYINSLGLGEFTAVHLRLEDDILPFRSAEEVEENKKKYLTQMKRQGGIFFLATYLGKAPHQNNSFLTLLERELPGRCKYWTSECREKSWRPSFPEVRTGREIDAIVDYLVCREATHFIGYRTSTFSEAIYDGRVADGKSSEYIN